MDDSTLSSIATGAGYAGAQSLANLAMIPLNTYLSDRQMDKQEGTARRLQEHQAELNAKLQRERNMNAMSELVAGARAAGMSPAAALGLSGSTASVAGGSMPSASTPQASAPSLLEASQASLVASQARKNNAEAKKIENENLDTDVEWRTISENLPFFFKELAKNETDSGRKEYYNNLIENIEANGTTTGAIRGYLMSVVNMPADVAEGLNRKVFNEVEFSKWKKMQAPDGLGQKLYNAYIKKDLNAQRKLYADIRLINSEIKANNGRMDLMTEEAKEAVARTAKFWAEANLLKTDWRQALQDSRFWDFMKQAGGSMIMSFANAGGEMANTVVSKKIPAKQLKKTTQTFQQKQYDANKKRVETMTTMDELYK